MWCILKRMATKTEAAYTKLLNDLTVVELRKKLSARGLSKGNSGLRKSEIISILLADKGYGSKAAAKKAVHTRRHDEYIKKSLKDVRPRIRRVASKDKLKPVPAHLLLVDDVSPKRTSLKRESPKRTSLKRESPKRTSLKRESPKRVSASKPRPSSSLSLKPLSVEHKRRTPPPPLPRDLPIPIVSEYLRACATTDEKEAKRIIGCLCKKFPNIVRCAKKGEKVKPGEIGMSLHSRSPSKSPRRSPPKSPPVPTSPAPSPSRASPKVAVLVKASSPSIPYAKIPIPPAPPAPPVFIPTRKTNAAAARPTVKVQTCAPNEVMGGSGVCIKLQRSSADKFNTSLLHRALGARRDVIANSLERNRDDSEWDDD
jgi:hypothetical protein